MYLPLNQSLDVESSLRMGEVKSKNDASLWEDVFLKGFGYKISHQLLLPDYDNTYFFIVHQGKEPVGTVVLHACSPNIIGIHSMSILPDMRRQGYAKQIMQILLSQSVKQGYRFATLQASTMGRGLYEKLGFTEHFTMKNYTLK